LPPQAVPDERQRQELFEDAQRAKAKEARRKKEEGKKVGCVREEGGACVFQVCLGPDDRDC